MKANLELTLITREVHYCFVRKVKDKRYLIPAIQHRINRLMNTSQQNNEQATLLLKEFKGKITELTDHFIAETTRFKELLQQKALFHNKPIHFIGQFRKKMILENELSPLLAYFLECYDRLVAILKLLHLAGCFNSEKDFKHTLNNYHKMANHLFCFLLFTPAISQ
ncbi:hypothetical protein [Legionella maceachernii]|uniref:Uncharacterized protein n=1 Tax=Legionella maceachernii TaxID=466 RepID=A0A0W0VV32_9GAMM|nr:hypothetical protein [Legionella maceachernii]KTD23919.1 hypothetical protein Lmac_2792 [Legionella maceachernii]SKA17892.1 hypothetical protein SAMN02745128_02418 [Legionella maceachernii]SUP04539.1 Uncharacterised protein [Legionella maceachernii]